ncbi:hypothetical protein, partial [Actinotignum sanguinis]|uniref:hypothetical protein n=1 Tax=Actinotignum sanguinis TaxID=1445614 RepID=UPI0025502B3B
YCAAPGAGIPANSTARTPGDGSSSAQLLAICERTLTRAPLWGTTTQLPGTSLRGTGQLELTRLPAQLARRGDEARVMNLRRRG